MHIYGSLGPLVKTTYLEMELDGSPVYPQTHNNPLPSECWDYRHESPLPVHPSPFKQLQ